MEINTAIWKHFGTGTQCYIVLSNDCFIISNCSLSVIARLLEHPMEGVCTHVPLTLGLVMWLALTNSVWRDVAHPHSSRSFKNHCVWISNISFSLFDMIKGYQRLGFLLLPAPAKKTKGTEPKLTNSQNKLWVRNKLLLLEATRIWGLVITAP